MPLFVVTGERGLALVEADDELSAKLDVMDIDSVSDPGTLNADTIDFVSESTRVMVLRSFVDDSPTTFQRKS